jgi:hypothetical protein
MESDYGHPVNPRRLARRIRTEIHRREPRLVTWDKLGVNLAKLADRDALMVNFSFQLSKFQLLLCLSACCSLSSILCPSVVKNS